ncbi:MAG: hypothetical protein HGA44_22425 [Cellulomonadaceae bacterium]|nr:hypothetical protein [Cellulomonadaceae bacterium]
MLTFSGLLPSWATSFQKLFDGDVLGALATLVGYGGQGVDQLTPGTAGGSRRAPENIVDLVGVAGVNEPDSANIISTDFDDGTAAADASLPAPTVPRAPEAPAAALRVVYVRPVTAGGATGGSSSRASRTMRRGS